MQISIQYKNRKKNFQGKKNTKKTHKKNSNVATIWRNKVKYKKRNIMKTIQTKINFKNLMKKKESNKEKKMK